MLRYLINSLIIASLVLMMAACVAWWRGRTMYEALRFDTGNRWIELGFENGQFRFSRVVVDPFYQAPKMEPGAAALDVSPAKARDLGKPAQWLWIHRAAWAGPPRFQDMTRWKLGVLEYYAKEPSITPGQAQILRRDILIMPIWLVALLFAVPPLCWILRLPTRRRQYRIAHGLCPACGYDQRGNAGSCPECGAARSLSRDH